LIKPHENINGSVKTEQRNQNFVQQNSYGVEMERKMETKNVTQQTVAIHDGEMVDVAKHVNLNMV
jgi:hypothetical protein